METRFRAMGTDVHVVVVGGDPSLAGRAKERVDDLERRWSRFLPDSELNQLNAAGGWPVVVSQETFDVVDRAVQAWWSTGGRFDPTVLPALVRAGYDRSFESLAPRADLPAPAGATPGCAEVDLAPSARTVTLPRGLQLDLGGIGKGYAADLVCDELLAWGAAGACVNLGGDLRVAGEAPTDDGWIVGLEDPFEPGTYATSVALSAGAVATTTRVKRRWQCGDTEAHHLIDPSSGAPAWAGVASVSVIDGEAWRAEALAKAAFVAGSDDAGAVLDAAGVTGLLFLDDGGLQRLPGLEAYER